LEKKTGYVPSRAFQHYNCVLIRKLALLNRPNARVTIVLVYRMPFGLSNQSVLVVEDSNDPELEAWCNCQRRWWRREYPGETDTVESSAGSHAGVGEHDNYLHAEMSTESKCPAGQNELAPIESRNLASFSRTDDNIQSDGNTEGESASPESSVSVGRQDGTCKPIPILQYLSQRRKSLLDKLGFVWHVDPQKITPQWDGLFQAVSY
jgi:hypothetical protein